jgi:hypothetical protein
VGGVLPEGLGVEQRRQLGQQPGGQRSGRVRRHELQPAQATRRHAHQLLRLLLRLLVPWGARIIYVLVNFSTTKFDPLVYINSYYFYISNVLIFRYLQITL